MSMHFNSSVALQQRVRWLLGAVAALGLTGVLAAVLLVQDLLLQRDAQRSTSAHTRALMHAEETLGRAQTAMYELTHEWKDLLFRARDADELARRMARFKKYDAQARTHLTAAQTLLGPLQLDGADLQGLRDRHAQTLARFEAAYALIRPGQSATYQAADDATHRVLGGLTRDLARVKDALDAQAQAHLDAQPALWTGGEASARLKWLGALAFGLPLVALVLFGMGWRAFGQIGAIDRRGQAIYKAISEAVVATDAQGRVRSLNPAAEALLGWPASRAANRPVADVVVLHGLDSDAPLDGPTPVAQVLQNHRAVALAQDALLVTSDGRRVAVAHTAAPIFDASGALTGVVMVLHDVSQRVTIRRELEHEHALYELSFQRALVGMAHVSPQGRWFKVNDRLCDMLGYSADELMALSFQGVTHPDDLANDFVHMRAMVEGREENYRTQKRYLHKGGQVVWADLSISLVRTLEGKPEFGITVIQDITAQRQAAEQVEFMAYHDQLTGLANRRLLHDRLAQAIHASVRRNTPLAVLFVDLDHFKLINDSLGHPVGDELLKHVAQRLSTLVRAEDTVARVGGDEFVLMLNGVSGADDASTMAQRLLREVSVPVQIGNEELRITPSVGISLCPVNGRDADELLRNADAALYQAKQMGRATYRFFTQALNDQAVEQIKIERLLHKALERNEFELYYQPQIDLRSGRVVACEALIRWNQPTMGLVEPDRFIPVAEHSAIINRIGRWVMHEACAQAKRWADQGRGIQVHFNVSARQFMHPDELLADLRSALACGVDPARVGIELTESLLLDSHHMGDVLDQIHAMGIGLALDDFGTGYSSLAYLRRFAIESLKIDRSFVGRSDHNEADLEMVKTIIGMARNLHMRLVAEGVETPAQRELLTAHHCDLAQGYHFARPLPRAQFEAFLDQQTG